MNPDTGPMRSPIAAVPWRPPMRATPIPQRSIPPATGRTSVKPRPPRTGSSGGWQASGTRGWSSAAAVSSRGSAGRWGTSTASRRETMSSGGRGRSTRGFGRGSAAFSIGGRPPAGSRLGSTSSRRPPISTSSVALRTSVRSMARYGCPLMAEDAKTLIEQATRSFLEEVPALKPMTLIVGVDLHGRGDTQQFRVELPQVDVRKDIAADARVRVEMRRDFFNAMVQHGAKVADWREAFEHGQAKATGVDQYMKLIVNVVERQEERNRTRRARH